MKQTERLQEVRTMRFEEVYEIWNQGRLTQEEAGKILGVCARTVRRYMDQYEEDGIGGLRDKRLTQASFRRAPVDEVIALNERYQHQHLGWNVKHFYSGYARDGGKRSYTWVKNTLQRAGLSPKGKKQGVHRQRREASPVPGMMLHQDEASWGDDDPGLFSGGERAIGACLWDASRAASQRAGVAGDCHDGRGQSVYSRGLSFGLQS